MKNMLLKIRWGLITYALGVALSLNAQVFTVLHDFTDSSEGARPGGVLLTNGVIYGAAAQGGSLYNGVIFSFSTDNGANYTVLHDFTNNLDGESPNDLVLDGATLYGTTQFGGTNNYGTIFKIGTNGLSSGYSILWSFTNSPDGAHPRAGLMLGGTTLYGTTYDGGSNSLGTIFKIGTNGANYTILHHFSTNLFDGQNPSARLILVGTNLYGTTYQGGISNLGTVFRIGTNGSGFAIMHSFTNSPDGANPLAGLAFNNNTLFGTTYSGGTNGDGTVFQVATNGANFALLHTFSNLSPNTNADGAYPEAALLVNSNMLYGTAVSGGNGGGGTVFQINTDGNIFTVLENFPNTPVWSPEGVLALNGTTLYGMSLYGGSDNLGAAFSLILSPVITQQPQSQTVTNGNPFSFTTAADGVPNLGYQWYFNTNTVIAGATNAELDYTAATNSLAGVYQVIITNSYGSVTSSFATLTVVAAPVIPPTPVILGFDFNPTNGSFSLSMSNAAASTNRLWASTNLVSTNFWQVIATNVQAGNGLWFFTDTNIAKTNSARFYRFSTP
jgi:uncharacterized repeat protein (TIGR03803 family)